MTRPHPDILTRLMVQQMERAVDLGFLSAPTVARAAARALLIFSQAHGVEDMVMIRQPHLRELIQFDTGDLEPN